MSTAAGSNITPVTMLSVPPMIYAAMSAVMADVGHIAKSRSNAQQGYKFRGIDEIYAAMQAPLVKHGVFCVPQVVEKDVTERQTKAGGTLIYTTLKVRHVFYAKDGSSVEAITVGEAMDSGDKSSNKAMSAALKYAMLEVFCIPTEGDNDTENHTHEVAARQVQGNATVAPRSSVTSTTPAPSTAPSQAEAPPAKSFAERYNDVCEDIERRMGMAMGNQFIDRIKAKHGGSAGTVAQKQACIIELEALVAGNAAPSDENGDDIAAMEGEP